MTAAAPLRVIFVIPGTGEGARMIFVRRQMHSLRDEGVEVETFHLKSRVSPLVLWRERARVRKLIRDFAPNIVHAQFGTMTAFFTVAATTKPVVITYRGSDLNPVPSEWWIRWAASLLLSQVASLRATKIVCVSCDLMRRLWWRKADAVIPSGIDTSIFRPADLPSARKTLGWSATERVVLFNAGHSPAVKRIDLAEAAIAVARQKVADLRLVVLDGSTDPGAVPVFLNAADCLLFTSDYEGSPNIVKEALACNLPVVTVAVGDVRERLENVEPSWIVDRDPQALGAAIVAAVTKPTRSNGFAAAEPLSLRATARRLVSLYREIASA